MQKVCAKFVVIIILSLWCAGVSQSQTGSDKADWHELRVGHATVHYTTRDKQVAGIVAGFLRTGEERVTNFFGAPFDTAYGVYIYPDRKALDKQWQQAWGDTSFHSECWMVASGVADRLDIVSPAIWASEKCEHNLADTTASRDLIVHELVHVYHGQHNPRKQFDGLDSLSWFVEGIATYASGQLDENHLKPVKAQIEAGKGPKVLGDFWKGNAKYGNAGSLMAYIEKTTGRKAIYSLLSQVDQQKMLEILSTSEPDLIAAWKKSLPSEFKMIIRH